MVPIKNYFVLLRIWKRRRQNANGVRNTFIDLALVPILFCPVKNKNIEKKTTKCQLCCKFFNAHGLASHQKACLLKAKVEKTQKKLPPESNAREFNTCQLSPQQETTISRNNDNKDGDNNAQIDDDDDDISFNSTDVDEHDKHESRVKNNQRTSTGNDDDDFSRISQGRICSNNVDINTDIDKNKINLKFDADGVDDPSITNENENNFLVGSKNSPIEFDEDLDNDEQGITIEINDDGDDDEQETMITIDDDLDDEEITLYVSDNCDDDIQITGSVGINALSDLPHPRHECVVKPFKKNPEEFCPNCYCYVCDIKASECDKWFGNHCKADGKWIKQRRQLRNKRKRNSRLQGTDRCRSNRTSRPNPCYHR